MARATSLLGSNAPRVLTLPMLAAALSSGRPIPARNTIFKWVREQVSAGALVPVTRGLYINKQADPPPSISEAASFVRSRAVVSLQSVLGEAGVTNNISDIITCVLPNDGQRIPSTRPTKGAGFEFRFHALPDRFFDSRGGAASDRLDAAVRYPRATPERALLDWIYLGHAHQAKISGPPLDTDLKFLDMARLRRLATAMDLLRELKQYLARRAEYHADPEVEANASNWLSER